jgi:hypothetical protein
MEVKWFAACVTLIMLILLKTTKIEAALELDLMIVF